MNAPQDLLAPLREVDSDVRPLPAAPLIERGRRLRQGRRFAAAGSSAAVLVAALGIGVTHWPGEGDTTLAAPGAAEGPGLIHRVGTAVLKAGTASMDMTVQVPTALRTGAAPAASSAPAPDASSATSAPMPELPSSVRAVGAVDFTEHTSTMKVSADVGGKALSVQILATPTNSYVSNPLKPGSWIAVPSLNEVFGLDGSGTPLDAQSILDQLPVDATDVSYIGDETLRGTPTSHFRGTFAPGGSATMPFDVWLDGAGLPRRVSVTEGTGASLAKVTIDMYGFGETVTIQTPPASSLIPLKDAAADLATLLPGLATG